MTKKRQITATLAVTVIAITVIGIGMGGVSGQILTEVDYYSENFSEYNESAIQLTEDDNLRNSYLVNPDEWKQRSGGDIRDTYDITYGEEDVHQNVNSHERWNENLDVSRPYLSATVKGGSRNGINRTIEVPEGVSDPRLVIEWAHENDGNSRSGRFELAVGKKLITSDDYDYNDGYGRTIDELWSSEDRASYTKVGTASTEIQKDWTTTAFRVDSGKENVSVRAALGQYDNSWHYPTIHIRQIYWTSGGNYQPTINGYESVPEDDSFGGPDPYNLYTVNEPTAEGEQVSLRSQSSAITKEYTFDGISEAQTTYFVIEGTSNSDYPVNYNIQAFGQEVASGTIDPQTTSEETVELDLETNEITLNVDSEGQYDIHRVGVSTLEQTSAGDPLATDVQPGGITLNAQEGYDRTVGVLITALGLTTDTLIYVLMIALALGAVAFTFSKSVRGQEFAQSMMMGAAIAGIVILGVVPTMNMATWIFTGDIQRAPLADPALEAEPPTYYSTEFQAGTMDGWSFDNARGQGSARPVSVGESFDVVFSGSADNSGIITHQEHISLGNSLGTGFVEVEGATTGTAGKTGPVHEVTFNVRVYTTEDGELEDSEMLDPNKNYIDEEGTVGAEGAAELRDQNESEHIAYVGEVARSFDGQTQQAEHLATFNLDGEYVHTELIVQDNRGDVNSQGTLTSVRVGATTESGSVDHS